MEIADRDYGGHLYSARDAEGHLWNFVSYDPWAIQRWCSARRALLRFDLSTSWRGASLMGQGLSGQTA